MHQDPVFGMIHQGLHQDTPLQVPAFPDQILHRILVGDPDDVLFDDRAFIEILPGVEGLCHISELAEGYVGQVTDVVNVGDQIEVEIINVDDRGKVKVSHKVTLPGQGASSEGEGGRDRERGHDRDRDRDRDRGGRPGGGGRRGGGGGGGRGRERTGAGER